MATAVDIANLALGHLGDRASISSLSPPEGSPQAGHAASFYPIALNSMLALHPWGFAIRRHTLVDYSLVAPAPSPWAYSYVLPSHVTVLAVLSDTASADAETQPYEIESADTGEMVIYTNQEDAVLRYVAFVTDTTKFPPLFVDALSYMLASYLAGPIIKGDAGMVVAREMRRSAVGLIGAGATRDANQRSTDARDDFASRPGWLTDRSTLAYR
jgi:hypothetical protein